MTTVDKVFELIESAERAMPARFTGNGDRTSSFCVNFSDLSEDTEIDLAAEAWYSMSHFFKEPDSANGFISRIGDDIMIGSYMIARLGEPERADELRDRIVISRLPYYAEAEILHIDPQCLLNYYNHCVRYGRDFALYGGRGVKSVVIASRM